MLSRNTPSSLRYLAGLLFALPGMAYAGEKINNPARGWDHLWNEMLIDITIIGVVFGLVTVFFMMKYRRRRPDQEGSPPRLSGMAVAGWVVIPAFLFMADDFFLAARSWQLWNWYRDVPADHMEIKLDAAMWSWTYTYPNGVQAVNELRVPAGKPILLRMTSKDVVHSHFIPDFRVKEDSMPGRVTYMWFYPQEPGEHVVTCAEYCGMMHSKMAGKVIVMPAESFARWYDENGKKMANRSDSERGV